MPRSVPALAARSPWLLLGLVAALAVAYAFLNLHSAWEPTTRLTNIRAGLVNADQPVTFSGTRVAVGEDLSRTLFEGKKFDWRVLSAKEAPLQLQTGTIDFYLYIPADASRLVAGLPTAQRPETAVLAVYANPAFNYPMHQVADTLAQNIREQLNGKIAGVYLEKLVGGIESAVKGMARAADGARQVADGSKVARGGAMDLAIGIDRVAAGTQKLVAGIGGAAGGADQLAGGAERVAAGARELAQGIERAAVGAGQVADGTDSAAAGAVRLAGSTDQAAGGTVALAGGLREAHGGAQSLADGLERAAAGAASLAGGTERLGAGAGQLVAGYGQLASGNEKLGAGMGAAITGIDTLSAAVKSSAGQTDPALAQALAGVNGAIGNLLKARPELATDPEMQALVQNLKQMQSRAAEVQRAAGVQLAAALAQIQAGLEEARGGSTRLAAGARQAETLGQEFLSGLTALQQGVGSLAGGVERAADGARALADGTGQLSAGGQQLAEGLERLRAGTQALSDGLQRLQAGGRGLAQGMERVQDGGRALAAGAGQVATGSRQLTGGMAQLQSGGEELSGGMGKLQDGGRRLLSGLGQLTSGSEQLASGLGAAGQTTAIPLLANAVAMSQPVQVAAEKSSPVPKPGEALAAPVLPTALWLGTLLLVAAAQLAGLGWGSGETAWRRLQSMLAPATILALAVTSVGLLSLGPRVAHPIWLLLFTLLVTYAFAALNQMLAGVLGTWGYGLSVLLLVLMPVAVGARAPYILLPGFYRSAAPFLPLSHAVRGVQAAMVSGAENILGISALVLGGFLILALAISRLAWRAEADPATASASVRA